MNHLEIFLESPDAEIILRYATAIYQYSLINSASLFSEEISISTDCEYNKLNIQGLENVESYFKDSLAILSNAPYKAIVDLASSENNLAVSISYRIICPMSNEWLITKPSFHFLKFNHGLITEIIIYQDNTYPFFKTMGWSERIAEFANSIHT